MPSDRLSHLLDELGDLGPVHEEELRLPESGEALRILQPVDTDLMLDRVEGDPEENLPYWAEIWPSGIALADAIVADPHIVRGRHVLEIGCGLGITAVAALRNDVELLVTDYALDALKLCRYNALSNTGREPATLQLNWRSPSDEFISLVGTGFPVVLAADVLYESRDIEPLVALVERIVAPHGLLWLAEPSRNVARRFVDLLESRAWAGEKRIHSGPWSDPKDAGVQVNIYQLRRSTSP